MKKIALILLLIFLATNAGAQSSVIRRPIFPAGGSTLAQVGSATNAAATIEQATLTTGTRAVGSATDTCLIAVITWQHGAGTATISSVVWNVASPQNFTRESGTQNAGGDYRVDMWWLKSPTSATDDVTVTWSANVRGQVSITEWSGCNNDPLINFNGANGDSGTATVNITSASGQIVIDGVKTSGAITVGANQTEQMNLATETTHRGGSSIEPFSATTTSPVVMTWTIASTAWVIGGASIQPAP